MDLVIEPDSGLKKLDSWYLQVKEVDFTYNWNKSWFMVAGTVEKAKRQIWWMNLRQVNLAMMQVKSSSTKCWNRWVDGVLIGFRRRLKT